MGYPAVTAVKLKELLQIHLYFPNYLQASLIWSDGNVFADKTKNMYFDCSDNSGGFFRHELINIILTILRRNISPLKRQTNINAHAQFYFAAKSPVISPKRNPPLRTFTWDVYMRPEVNSNRFEISNVVPFTWQFT